MSDRPSDRPQPPPSEAEAGHGREPDGGLEAINIRNLSVKCGNCDTYQTLSGFARRDAEWNVYTYECENDVCDPEVTRTLVEVPAELDSFARRDPEWKGGARHAGGD